VSGVGFVGVKLVENVLNHGKGQPLFEGLLQTNFVFQKTELGATIILFDYGFETKYCNSRCVSWILCCVECVGAIYCAVAAVMVVGCRRFGGGLEWMIRFSKNLPDFFTILTVDSCKYSPDM